MLTLLEGFGNSECRFWVIVSPKTFPGQLQSSTCIRRGTHGSDVGTLPKISINRVLLWLPHKAKPCLKLFTYWRLIIVFTQENTEAQWRDWSKQQQQSQDLNASNLEPVHLTMTRIISEKGAKPSKVILLFPNPPSASLLQSNPPLACELISHWTWTITSTQSRDLPSSLIIARTQHVPWDGTAQVFAC